MDCSHSPVNYRLHAPKPCTSLLFKLKLNPCTKLGVFFQVYPIGLFTLLSTCKDVILYVVVSWHRRCCYQLNDPNDARGHTSPVRVHQPIRLFRFDFARVIYERVQGDCNASG